MWPVYRLFFFFYFLEGARDSADWLVHRGAITPFMGCDCFLSRDGHTGVKPASFSLSGVAVLLQTCKRTCTRIHQDLSRADSVALSPRPVVTFLPPPAMRSVHRSSGFLVSFFFSTSLCTE